MSDAESAALGRVAALLLAASLLRCALAPSAPPGTLAPGPDVLPALTAESEARADEEGRRARPLGPGERLDPNRASEIDLDRLPGVGPATARALVASREADGPFAAAEDLLRVRGVGPALLARVRAHLTLPAAGSLAEPGGSLRAGPAPRTSRSPPGATAPLDLNRADTLALRLLPGVGPALARRIVEARRDQPFRTVDELVRVRGIGPATLERLRPLVTVGR